MSILKIFVYGLLFLILSPGFIFNLYPDTKGIFLSNETTYLGIFLHGFLLAIILSIFEEKKYLDPKENIQTQLTLIETRELIPIITLILFILLTPGLIITIPSENNGIFFSKETSPIAVIIHSIIFLFSFGIIVNILDKYKSLIKI
jgi:hypothetical protein